VALRYNRVTVRPRLPLLGHTTRSHLPGISRGSALVPFDVIPSRATISLDVMAIESQDSPARNIRIVGEEAHGINANAQFISICRWLQLIYKNWLAPLEKAVFSTPWARKRYRVAQLFR